MRRRMPGRCPVCGETMDVTRLHCPTCDTALDGRFETCRFCQLSDEMRDFVEIFIKSRGNIKEVERALGVSYPTVRGRLDAVIKALGYSVDAAGPEEDRGERRREVLELLSKGEIGAQEAANRLRQI
ncbi:MAG: DUF2089 domain-containing protein [Bacillota bacterium]|nr:DUF2089 domain-containing protein [Bacillota bacterium]